MRKFPFGREPGEPPTGGDNPDNFEALRRAMVDHQLKKRDIIDQRVLAAMAAVPRHEFVAEELRDRAYEDSPLPIGNGQTISQPYIVAAMTSALHLNGPERVLEIGGGCGYQAAVLALLTTEVFSVEVRADLATTAAARLQRLGYHNVHVHCGDGTLGLPEMAPFDAILVAAAAPSMPPPLLAQLAQGGRIVAPIGGTENQELQLVERYDRDYRMTSLEGCRFVPLVGAHGWKESRQ
jgi:protein-L-isoaspartate(D-aspartate) O-methyltransferase